MSSNDSIKKPLKEWLQDFYDDTSKISDIVRNLGFAAIGIIWIFKNKDLTQNILPSSLVPALGFAISGLVIEFFQYLWRAISNYCIYRKNEIQYNKGKLNDDQISDITAPVFIEVITWLLFIAKIVLIAIAYIKIYQFFICLV